jgi:hypothetical protein
VAALSPSTYTVEVASAAMRPGCGRDGDSVTFRLRRGDEVIALTPAAVFRSGQQYQLNLNGFGAVLRNPSAGMSPGGSTTGTVVVCPRFEVTLMATASSQTRDVRLQWSASGGCTGITGTITARYLDQPAYAMYPISSGSGTIVDRPPSRCQGSYTVQYTIELTNSGGQRVSTQVMVPNTYLC